MELPNELNNAIECVLNDIKNIAELDKSAKMISERYRANNNDGKRLLTENVEAIAYACSRMPATFGAVTSVFNSIFEYNEISLNSVLDVGAGTGTATWAIYNLLGKKKFSCFEREEAMIDIGKQLMDYSIDLKNVEWKKFDIISDCIDKSYDAVIASYLINEVSRNNVEDVIKKLWNSTNNLLIIIEPGTPRGFSNIKKIRDMLLKMKAHIVAPCSHESKCELPEDDWCQFTCRVQRSKIHKKLKDGQAGFEDEKFSYIVFSKNETAKVENRILRHPIINKGFSEFKVCTKDGIKNIRISKKDGEVYKTSKKKNSGDSLNFKCNKR